MSLRFFPAVLLLLFGLSRSSIEVDTQVDPANWMGSMNDMKLVEIPVIPGTHHSATGINPPKLLDKVIWGFSKCQSMSIADQLEHGVRFLDLRLTVDDKNRTAIISHRVETGIDLNSVLAIVNTFLSTHKTEGVLVYVRIDFDSTQPAHGPEILSEIIEKANVPLVGVSSVGDDDISHLRISDIAGRILLITEENTLADSTPHLMKSVLAFTDIWRYSQMSEARAKVAEVMTQKERADPTKIVGVALDGMFIPAFQAETSPKMDAWFMCNLENNPSWSQVAAKRGVGLVLMDFIEAPILRSLLALNFRGTARHILRGRKASRGGGALECAEYLENN